MILTCALRGSLPPVIGVAWYQSTDISDIYSTLGYLVPLISVLAMVRNAVQPLLFSASETCFNRPSFFDHCLLKTRDGY
jgi:hypothetical protein